MKLVAGGVLFCTKREAQTREREGGNSSSVTKLIIKTEKNKTDQTVKGRREENTPSSNLLDSSNQLRNESTTTTTTTHNIRAEMLMIVRLLVAGGTFFELIFATHQEQTDSLPYEHTIGSNFVATSGPGANRMKETVANKLGMCNFFTVPQYID